MYIGFMSDIRHPTASVTEKS